MNSTAINQKIISINNRLCGKKLLDNNNKFIGRVKDILYDEKSKLPSHVILAKRKVLLFKDLYLVPCKSIKYSEKSNSYYLNIEAYSLASAPKFNYKLGHVHLRTMIDRTNEYFSSIENFQPL